MALNAEAELPKTRELSALSKAELAKMRQAEKEKLLSITKDPSTWGDDLAEVNALILARVLASHGIDIRYTNILNIAEQHAKGEINLNSKRVHHVK